MRYYVVADIHSFYDELIETLSGEGYFSDMEPHKLIVCGDLFDRGTQSVELQKFILELMTKDEVILIRGNHESLMLELIKNSNFYFNKGIARTHHWSNGTVQTLFDLTGMNMDTNTPEEIVRKMEKTPFIKQIIPSMKDYFETEHYVFVHGWIPTIVLRDYGRRYLPIEEWRTATEELWEKARWLNGMEAWSQGISVDGKTIVCGHFHTSWGHAYLAGECNEFGEGAIFEPFSCKGILAIDACTAYSGKMNCVVLED